jgi:pilus assembly protein Flp/PilA
MEQISTLLKVVKDGAVDFVNDEEGAQIVEYALIIAVVSIALIVLMASLVNGGAMSTWIGRVTTCLTGGTCA